MRRLLKAPLFEGTTISSIKTWLLTWKTLPVWSWIRAAELYRQGRFPEAATMYKKGLERYPQHPARHCATIDLARCLFADGKIQEAEQYLRQLVAQIPSSRTAHKALFLFQLRIGHTLDAAWTMRRALRSIVPEPELIGLYLYCVVENGGPEFLLKEAERLVKSAKKAGRETPLMRAAEQKRDLLMKGYSPHVLKKLEEIANEHPEDVEIGILAAGSLREAGKVASARRVLRRALHKDPTHPRVLSLFSETYLLSGSFYNPEFALQLATEACKRTNWRSPREMHILAEVFFHCGDPLTALATAERAKEEGSRLLGTYRDTAALDRLIEELNESLSKDTPVAA
ncbi:MAG: tetratricopeptide repeat protein [Bdellovibrionales bacterium]|nr:tetratricopeptide repeat protein [Bdellovibrionales bacterium]